MPSTKDESSVWPLATASDLAREAAAVIALKKAKRKQQQEAAMHAEGRTDGLMRDSIEKAC